MNCKTVDQIAEDFAQWRETVDIDDLREADTSSLRRITELADRRESIDDELAAAVAAARRDRHSWALIGAMLGVSRQAAHHKYKDHRAKAA